MKHALAWIVLVVLLAGVPALAQDSDLTETFSDEILTFQYPTDWVVQTSDEGITLSNAQAGLEQDSLLKVAPDVISVSIGGGLLEFGSITVEESSPEFVAGIAAGTFMMGGIVLTSWSGDVEVEIAVSELEPFAEEGGVSFTIEMGEPLSLEMLFIALPDQILLAASAPAGELDQWTETVFAIAETVTLNE